MFMRRFGTCTVAILQASGQRRNYRSSGVWVAGAGLLLSTGTVALCEGEKELTARSDFPLASYIDHTLLRPNATFDEIKRVCDEAIEFNFASVCVNSYFVGKVAHLLAGSLTKPISVIGFPLGAMTTASKAYEAREAISAGAQEIDMVINVGALRSKDYETVVKDIQAVVAASRPYPVKVILETALLNKDEIVTGCVLSKAAGAAFVKTCTGFGGGGATVEDVRLMRSTVGSDVGVKASGGVRTLEDALAMIEAGADRIGTSSGVAILQAYKNRGNGSAVVSRADGGSY